MAKEKEAEVVEVVETPAPKVVPEPVVEEVKPKPKKKAVKKEPVEPVEPTVEVADRKHLGGSQGKIPVVSYDHREGYVYCKAANGAGYKFTLVEWNSGKPLS